MDTYELIERPPRNRRRLHDPSMDWDNDLKVALLETHVNGRAIKLPLWRFHSSPAKGHLWAHGFKVRHRVLPDRQTVAAWCELGDPE